MRGLRHTTCQRASDCWPGNDCVSGACQPSAAGCRRDTANDQPSGAELLSNTASTTPTICGADVDWYRIELAAGGRLLVAREFPQATLPEQARTKRLVYWVHVVKFPPQLGAATSPQSMMSPPVVQIAPAETKHEEQK